MSDKQKLNDESPMPYGKTYKGTKMEDVPAWHLLWWLDQDFCPDDLREYIEDNMDVLIKEQAQDQ